MTRNARSPMEKAGPKGKEENEPASPGFPGIPAGPLKVLLTL